MLWSFQGHGVGMCNLEREGCSGGSWETLRSFHNLSNSISFSTKFGLESYSSKKNKKNKKETEIQISLSNPMDLVALQAAMIP